MLHEECKYCKNFYSDKISDNCMRVFKEDEVDQNGIPIQTNSQCCGFRRKGMFQDLPYVVTKNDLINYIGEHFYRLMENYSANDLLNILHEDIADQIYAFMDDYFYDAAILNGVKIKEG